MTDASVVRQLKEIVEESRVLDQLAGAGRTEQLSWAMVHLAVLVLVVLGTRIALSSVATQEREESLIERDASTWRCVLWVGGSLLVLLFAVLATCDLVTYYQYCQFPRAMVLRDILERT